MTRNEAGGPAYALPPRHALAQYAVTGCLNATFYAGAEAQLNRILALAGQVDPAFVAKTAVYCRTRGYMKDTPALLCAALATLDVPLLESVFDRVIDDGRTLRSFVQIVRSGATGRKSLGSARRAGWCAAGWNAATTRVSSAPPWDGPLPWRTWSRWYIPARPTPGGRRCTAGSSAARTTPRCCRRWCASSRRSRAATSRPCPTCLSRC